jgi:methylglutaconyl-CoA hydratase
MRKCSKIIGAYPRKSSRRWRRYSRGLRLCFATIDSAIKLSELAIGIGPFVIEPAVSRKIGKTAMTEMTLAATEWKNTDWAHDKGLYAKVLANQVELDIDIAHFTKKLASYNPEALVQMKK